MPSPWPPPYLCPPLAAYATWRDRGIAPAHVGVNFTGAELASGVAVEVIRWATDAAGIRPEVAQFALEDANRALVELKEGDIRGAKVLKIG